MRVHWTFAEIPACRRSMRLYAALRLQVTRNPERVTCKRCLVILRNIGQVAEGKLRAAGEEVA